MRYVTIEEFSEIVETMTISHSIDSGIVITHFGEVGGSPTIAISTCRGEGICYILD